MTYDTGRSADYDTIAAGFRNVYGSIAGAADVLIAASNAPASVKRRANYVCTGTNDDVTIQAAINALPAAPTMSRNSRSVSGGVMGNIQLSSGKFAIASAITIPPASIVGFRGVGVSSWIPTDTMNSMYEGGTQIYSTDSTGAAFIVYRDNGSGVATTSLSGGTFPTTAIFLENIEFRVFNPASNQSTSKTVNLDGMITGTARNINVFADLTTNATHNLAYGFSIEAGSACDRKLVESVSVFNFRTSGFRFATTHLVGLQLCATSIGTDAFAQGFTITPEDDIFLEGLHAFSVKYAIGVSNNATLPLRIGSIHMESVTTPMLVDATSPVYVDFVELDTGTPWSGDIASSKVAVGNVCYKSSPTAKSRNRGTASISAATSVVVNHGLFTTPTNIMLTPKGSAGAQCYYDTAGTTSFTIHIPSSGTVDIDWRAEV